MKKELCFAIFILFLLGGCGDTSTPDAQSIDQGSSSYTNNEDDKNENDDYSSASVSYHNQGASCLSCHGGSADGAEGKSFLSGGTVYTKLAGSSSKEYADGYKIRILLDIDSAINFTGGRGTGNSYSNNSALSSSYKFTAQVLDSNYKVVNSSATNSHSTQTNLSCNTCHTASGSNGAPGRITSLR